MKPVAIIKTGGLPRGNQGVTQAVQIRPLALSKLSALTHGLQLIIRTRPKRMLEVLAFYQYFLSVKEELEHYFSREHAILEKLQGTGTGPAPAGVPGPYADLPLRLGSTLYRLKVELSGFVVILSCLQLNHKALQGYSLALQLFFRELENFTRMLHIHQEQLATALPQLPLQADKKFRPRLLTWPPAAASREGLRKAE